MSDFRIKKIQSLLRDEISSMIIKGVIKDPRVGTFISITEVKVSKDVGYVKIYISGFKSNKSVKESVKALNHAAGFIQKKLGERLHMRSTPKITFFTDDSIEHGIYISKKIEDLIT